MKLNGELQGLAIFTRGEISAFIEQKVVSEKEEVSNQCQPFNYNSTVHQL